MASIRESLFGRFKEEQVSSSLCRTYHQRERRHSGKGGIGARVHGFEDCVVRFEVCVVKFEVFDIMWNETFWNETSWSDRICFA